MATITNYEIYVIVDNSGKGDLEAQRTELGRVKNEDDPMADPFNFFPVKSTEPPVVGRVRVNFYAGDDFDKMVAAGLEPEIKTEAIKVFRAGGNIFNYTVGLGTLYR